jgi:hypothetical protein
MTIVFDIDVARKLFWCFGASIVYFVDVNKHVNLFMRIMAIVLILLIAFVKPA